MFKKDLKLLFKYLIQIMVQANFSHSNTKPFQIQTCQVFHPLVFSVHFFNFLNGYMSCNLSDHLNYGPVLTCHFNTQHTGAPVFETLLKNQTENAQIPTKLDPLMVNCPRSSLHNIILFPFHIILVLWSLLAPSKAFSCFLSLLTEFGAGSTLNNSY